MFCTTFYSYKGGVGRTLALANVACVLAKRGKRVLVVDFDLEAPGLITLPGFSAAAGMPGIVDLIDDFVTAGRPPECHKFIHRCEIEHEFRDDEGMLCTEAFSIDVMPAGLDGDDGYSDRLNRIDWSKLYNESDGFMLMEEVRAQWERAGYDYVLIDSRTGLTDVGGICTRQLPDAVVAVFFPNEQNLVGLRQVVRSIRTSGARPKSIDLMFVASRVPRLDDEHGYLSKWLDRFSEELGYSKDAVQTVEHYDSMTLLNQTLFVVNRPTSGLARQYAEVADHIARLNAADFVGARAYLTSIINQSLSFRTHSHAEISDRLDAIRTCHPNDYIIQFLVARYLYSVRDLAEALQACDRAVASGGTTAANSGDKISSIAGARNLRLRIQSELGRSTEALQDARAILADNESRHTSLVDAVLALASADQHALDDPLSLPAIAAAVPDQLFGLAAQLFLVENMQKQAAEIVEAAYAKAPQDAPATIDILGTLLILIAGKRFGSAVAIGDQCLAGTNINPQILLNTTFNVALAAWGCDGSPDLGRWGKVRDLFEKLHPNSTQEPNWEQCRALTYAVLGDVPEMERAAAEAKRLAPTIDRREFSCWDFSNVNASTFETHVEAIRAYAHQNGPPPPSTQN